MNALKAVLAVVVAALGALVTALGPGDVALGDLSARDWLVAALAVLGSGGLVWLVENGPAAPIAKAIMALLTGGIGALVLALDDNVLTTQEILAAAATAIVATGLVYQAKNAPPA